MDWIKKNPAPLTLAIAAILAITATVLLWMKVSDFDSTFAASRGREPSKTPVEPLSTKALDDARTAIATPVKWESAAAEASKLFVSKLYVIKDGKLVSPGTGSFHPPVPNEWLRKYHLNELSATVLTAISIAPLPTHIVELRLLTRLFLQSTSPASLNTPPPNSSGARMNSSSSTPRGPDDAAVGRGLHDLPVPAAPQLCDNADR